jgi:putative FmdB family regulatory protein
LGFLQATIRVLDLKGKIEDMPIYEYECHRCKVQFQSLVMKNVERDRLTCPECGGKNLKRLISRVAYHISDQDRLNAFDPTAPRTDSFYKDSRNIGLQAKKKAQQMGVDLGKGFEDKLEKLRTDPGSVIKDND